MADQIVPTWKEARRGAWCATCENHIDSNIHKFGCVEMGHKPCSECLDCTDWTPGKERICSVTGFKFMKD